MDITNAKFIVASGPVIVEDGKVLLNRHGDDNFWKFTGGRVESADFDADSDALEEACHREAKEEMGFEIEIIRPLKTLMIPHPEKSDTIIMLVHYLARRIGEIKIGADIKEYDWFDLNDLPQNCAPNIGPIVEEYQAAEKQGSREAE